MARETAANASTRSGELVPNDYDQHGADMRKLKAKYYDRGNRILQFGKYYGKSVWEIVENHWDYVEWCLDQPRPSNVMISFLRSAVEYKTLKEAKTSMGGGGPASRVKSRCATRNGEHTRGRHGSWES